MVTQNRRRVNPKLLAAVILTLAVTGVTLLLDLTGLLEPAENKAYDLLFQLRTKIRPPAGHPERPLALIGLDDATFAHPAFRKPVILWHQNFQTVIRGLAESGVKAIGLDFLLPGVSFDDVVPNYSRTWLVPILEARRRGAPVITGWVQHPDRQRLPEAKYLQIIGPENLGLFNLTVDSDDFIRRQRLFFPAQGQGNQGSHGVAFLWARVLKPDLSPTAEVIHIDYDPASTPYPRYSFGEIFDRAANQDTEYLRKNFAGRLVIIGQTDSLSDDRHPTPLYHVTADALKRTPGVEILVQTVLTLTEGRYFQPTSLPGRAAWYLLLALLAGVATLWASPRRPLWFTGPGAYLLWGGISLEGFLSYRLLPAAGGTVALTLSLAAAFAFRHWVVDREKRQVRQAFTRYLSPQVVTQVLERPEMLSLGGSRRVMTVFFSDLAGFTSISESLTPEDLVRLLNRYLDLMTKAILDRGGTVDKFEGDAIMAFWGAPLVQEDHALRACLAALDQQQAMQGLREEIKAQGLPELQVRMGLNTGPMIVGNMGSEARFDYTVMGDAVNLASRLEGANKAYGSRIMISEFTFQEVRGRIEVRELDMIRVKGRTQPIRVYELLAPAGELPPTQAELRNHFNQALDLYRRRLFGEALVALDSALELDPRDGPCRAYRERCQLYLKDPPPSDWDGVFTMTTK